MRGEREGGVKSADGWEIGAGNAVSRLTGKAGNRGEEAEQGC